MRYAPQLRLRQAGLTCLVLLAHGKHNSFGCGQAVQRSSERRNLTSSTSRHVVPLWKTVLGSALERRGIAAAQSESMIAELDGTGYMCRKCFYAYERVLKLKTTLEENAAKAIDAIVPTRASPIASVAVSSSTPKRSSQNSTVIPPPKRRPQSSVLSSSSSSGFPHSTEPSPNVSVSFYGYSGCQHSRYKCRFMLATRIPKRTI